MTPDSSANRDELAWRNGTELDAVPAQQGFHADHVAAVQADLRLVMNGQFAIGQGVAQGAFETEAAGGVGIHFRRVEAEGVTSGLLGPRQRRIRRLEQIVGAAAVARGDADADAGGEGDGLAGDDQRLGDGVEHALGQGDGVVFLAQAGHDETEFVAGAAADGVTLTHLQIQAADDFAQGLVAGGRTEAFIDRAEAVEVEQDHRRLPVETLGSEQRLGEAVGEQVAVGQVGQRVVARQVLDALGCRLAFGKVAEDADVVRQPPVAVIDGGNAQPFGNQLAVLAPVGDLALPAAMVNEGVPHGAVEGRAVCPGLEQ
jgi:hypothetical protein